MENGWVRLNIAQFTFQFLTLIIKVLMSDSAFSAMAPGISSKVIMMANWTFQMAGSRELQSKFTSVTKASKGARLASAAHRRRNILMLSRSWGGSSFFSKGACGILGKRSRKG